MKLRNPRIVASEQRPRSILITKAVYHDIYPFEKILRTVPVIFSRVGGRAQVEKEIAEYLVKNYEGITIDPYIEPVVIIPEPEPEPENLRPTVSIPEIDMELEEEEEIPEPIPDPEIIPLTNPDEIEMEAETAPVKDITKPPKEGGKKR